jgi:membrane-bound metal-dependent hydrolase YbcI (DUF457 family)
MFVLGHVGISLGIIVLVAWYYSKYVLKEGSVSSFIGKIDFRIVVVSAMFPDLVDKLIGMLILGEEVANGRIFTHSVITVTVLAVAILNLSKIKFSRLSIPALYIFPAFLHLVFDFLWDEPETLLWPLLGTGFPKVGVEFADYFDILLSDPLVWTTEIIGSVIIIILFIRFRVYLKDNFVAFIKKGRLRST